VPLVSQDGCPDFGPAVAVPPPHCFDLPSLDRICRLIVPDLALTLLFAVSAPSAIIFLAPMSAFDQVLEEDHTVSRIVSASFPSATDELC
jgi:hypothetical protein